MASRVRILQRETGPDQPDYPIVADLFGDLTDLFGDLDDGPPPDVEVMTPERLAHLLRHDTPAVLDRFGMFIFDEAQLIKEQGRGFTLESTIALLHYATRDSRHQVVLISAALGNAGAIAQWIGPDDNALLHQSEWRGPRRLHAAFCTEADWTSTRVEVSRGWKYPFRLVTDLGGLIRLRLSDRRTAELRTQGSTGWRLVRKSETQDLFQSGLPRDTGRSTPQYRIASQMIQLLGHAGSVLVVAGTRKDAQRLASGLADELPEHPGSAPLVDFVRLQLGDEHPLVAVLRHGVGFHHAGLPIEVLEALEDAIRSDTLPYLACTSTLTDGVNLPVRTVVIYDQTYEGQAEDVRIRGARMVNAMGRAGRAGKETEGWIVLVRAAAPTPADFHDLDPSAAELAVTSSLITDEALHAFAELEQILRDDEDAVFQPGSGAATDFISYVWFILAVEEGEGADLETVDIGEIVDSTLAAQQSSRMRAACLPIAEAVRRAYVRADADARQRWPRTGTSIGSARTIDLMARRIADTIIVQEQDGTLGDITDPLRVIRMLAPTIDQLLLRALPGLDGRDPHRTGQRPTLQRRCRRTAVPRTWRLHPIWRPRSARPDLDDLGHPIPPTRPSNRRRRSRRSRLHEGSPALLAGGPRSDRVAHPLRRLRFRSPRPSRLHPPAWAQPPQDSAGDRHGDCNPASRARRPPGLGWADSAGTCTRGTASCAAGRLRWQPAPRDHRLPRSCRSVSDPRHRT